MTAKQFLHIHGQSADDIDIGASLEELNRQMKLGLRGEGGLPMIPTYLDPDRADIVKSSKRILIDAGGTNFRSALGYFDADGKVRIEDLRKTGMPASDRLLSKSEFYGQIADNISRLLPQSDKIGFCFSYPIDMDKDVDGYVQPFTKEVKAPEVVGTKVGAETVAACKALDGNDRKAVILNDTVATLLGGMAIARKRYSSYLGYIYGTGTNVCYIEDTSAITKVKGLPVGRMLVNTECGSFNGFPQGDFDRRAIERTDSPDRQLFEKMTSGKYLAEVIYRTFLAAEEESLFAQAHIRPFDLRDVSEFLNGGMCGMFASDSDVSFAKELCSELVRRAAKMGAIVNSAFAIASVKDKSLPVCIVAEGTTFCKLPGYRDNFQRYLTEILGGYGIRYEILQGEELNLIGTLMATMTLK